MSHSRLAEIARQFVIEPEVAPAAVVAVAWRGARGWESADGAAFADRADNPSVGSAALFDLASITKPFMALTVARLARRGRLSLDTPLGELLPEASGTATGTASLLQLLSHRAGLEAHRTLFAPLLAGLPFDRADAIAEIVHGRRPECLDGGAGRRTSADLQRSWLRAPWLGPRARRSTAARSDRGPRGVRPARLGGRVSTFAQQPTPRFR